MSEEMKTLDEAAIADRKFQIGDRVRKNRGSSWHGRVVGFYSTSLTPVGYAVESEREPGSVQIYPEAALSRLDAGEVCVEAPQCCMCGKKELSTNEGDGGAECELSDGRWVCSIECWDRALDIPSDNLQSGEQSK